MQVMWDTMGTSFVTSQIIDRSNAQASVGRILSLLFFQAEDGIRDVAVTGVQTCALPISPFLLPPPTANRRPEGATPGRYGDTRVRARPRTCFGFSPALYSTIPGRPRPVRGDRKSVV